IAFTSADGLLAAGSPDDTNNVSDVFVYSTFIDRMTRVDVGWGWPIAGGYIPGDGPTEWPTLSADGRYVAVHSSATNVELPVPPGSTHVYVYDRLERKPTRISINPNGTSPDRDCVQPQMSSDGSVVLFNSAATNIRADATGGVPQIYAAVHFDVT